MLKTVKVLEFDKILAQLAFFAVSQPSKEAIMTLVPAAGDLAAVRRLLEMTNEAYLVRHKYVLSPIAEFDDAAAVNAKAGVGGILTMGELLKVARLLRAGRIAQKSILSAGEDVTLLKALAGGYFVDEELEKNIGVCILSENEMSDNASDKLKSIRRKILSANSRLKEKLNGYFRSGEYSKYLQDNLVTIRNGRFVLPVKNECRAGVPGLIHDQSATGATVFIEPYAVVEMNNEIKTLKLEENSEIERILSELTAAVAANGEMIVKMQSLLIELDVIFAKCDFGVSIGGIMPKLNKKGIVRLTGARHPLIEADKIVPVDIAIGDEYRILTITGPNTGGKTVCLKTVGLLCLMAYTGIFIPAGDDSELAVFDDIFCDIGDEQSISLSLSTFSGHIVNIAYIADNVTPDSLVLLDEIGAGTDPDEGAALAVGILKYVELIGCSALITTHYGALKEYALTSPRIINGCMQFDERTLKPTYKLMIGIPGTSKALHIAAALGLNDYILKQARLSLETSKVDFEKVLYEAERAKSAALGEASALAAQRREIDELKIKLRQDEDKLKAGLEKINESARIEVKRIVANAVETAESLIDEIKEAQKKGDEQALIEAHKAKRKLEDLKYRSELESEGAAFESLPAAEMKTGVRVFIRSLGAEGILLSLPDKRGEAKVRLGAMALSVPASEIGRTLKADPKPQRQLKKIEIKPAEEQPLKELKVLGLTVAEAIEAIEPYLIDMAAGESGKLLKIVHGKGTGALGKGIQQYLRTSPYVHSYRYGGYGEGDRGVTITEIK